jgi:anthranilate synthase/phosphoribosyltransferase
MSHVFVIDNYDSFTYNLVQLLQWIGAATTVARNDAVTLDEIEAAQPTHLVISPGPCTPAQAGISVAAVRRFAGRIPVLGVCLGHQCIAEAFGGRVRRAAAPVHGKTDRIHHDGHTLFRGLPDPFSATRYHSLVVDVDLPAEMELSAWNEEGEVMAMRHTFLPVEGVQFHPESVLTEAGADLLRNFLHPGAGQTTAVRPAETASVVDPRPADPPAQPTPATPNEQLSEALRTLTLGRDLTSGQARAVLLEIMGGRASATQTAALLSALRVKGETAAEIVGMAQAMTELAEKVEVDADVILDTCGTGGDGRGTFNVSTAAALIAAGAGVTVAKHGNRSATSCCGSADVLEALGVAIDIAPSQVGRCVAEAGIGFMFAPRHHTAMRTVAGIRRELGMATTFNVIGPLTNPAGARHQLIGVGDPRYVDRLAEAVRMIGSQRNLVVHSDDGLDEISTTCPTTVVEVFAGQGYDRRYTVTPEEFGFARASLEDLRGGDAATNAHLLHEAVDGVPGPRLDIALLNAGAALYIAEAAASIAEGVENARAAVACGAARARLDALIAVTNRLKAEVA